MSKDGTAAAVTTAAAAAAAVVTAAAVASPHRHDGGGSGRSASSGSARLMRKQIRRNRESLACQSCRTRKLRCDKGQPCGSCVRREDVAGCVYRKPTGGSSDQDERRGDGGEPRSPDRRSDAEEKLERLEVLVKQLVKSRSTLIAGGQSATAAADGTGVGAGPGNSGGRTAAEATARRGGVETSSDSDAEENDDGLYVGSTHWSTMLNDIKELKEIMRSTEEAEAESEWIDYPSMDFECLFRSPRGLTVDQVIAEFLPSKTECDRSVAGYFRAKAVSGSYIHSLLFMRQYASFWADYSSASALWVSMLFGVLHLSTRVGYHDDSEFCEIKDAEERAQRYLIAQAHCLALGRYYQPKPFSVEAIALFIQCKCTYTLDASREIGILLGTMVQLAHMLGYHRDPDHLRNATPFQKEMRRRVWAIVMQLDLLLSFQLGIPSNTQVGTWDTKLAVNMLDTDFDEDTQTMPTPRPDSEPTKILFNISKQKLVIAFERILRHALTSTYNEAELVMLDVEIRETYTSLPAKMRSHPDSELLLLDEPFLIATRLCTQYMLQKSLCVLHRKYVTRGREASVQTCISAASIMVKELLRYFPEFKPGGQLYGDRWLMSSIMWNDFLMGIMVLCLVVAVQRRGAAAIASATAVAALEHQQADILNLLKLSWAACAEKAAVSAGARRVCRLLGATFAPPPAVQGEGQQPISIMQQGSSAGQSLDPLQTNANMASSGYPLSLPSQLGDAFGFPLSNVPSTSEEFMNLAWDENWMEPMGGLEDMQQFLDLQGNFPEFDGQ